MLAAPPFFLVGIFMAAGFMITITSFALTLKYLLNFFPDVKLPKPLRTVIISTAISFFVYLVASIPGILTSKIGTPGSRFEIPPYTFWLATVFFLMILFRQSGNDLNFRKIKIAFILSTALVLWITTMEKILIYFLINT
ncbi:hypothetical protein DD235_16550 [Corticimicrobacter populi]|uniref:Uncharacterized protein n=1 Tax=Corticimicrobacter populi TaxID=2175229 RepID=A0A2V1JT27_9BURK|nr:hypothetical protein DD235_16550 [Corticimicrobacter populi]